MSFSDFHGNPEICPSVTFNVHSEIKVEIITITSFILLIMRQQKIVMQELYLMLLLDTLYITYMVYIIFIIYIRIQYTIYKIKYIFNIYSIYIYIYTYVYIYTYIFAICDSFSSSINLQPLVRAGRVLWKIHQKTSSLFKDSEEFLEK